jgi:hypothetical protein
MICSFIIYWASLLKEEDLEKQVIQGVEAVKTIALFFHNKDMEMQSQDDRQLVPYVSCEGISCMRPACCLGRSPVLRAVFWYSLRFHF